MGQKTAQAHANIAVPASTAVALEGEPADGLAAEEPGRLCGRFVNGRAGFRVGTPRSDMTAIQS